MEHLVVDSYRMTTPNDSAVLDNRSRRNSRDIEVLGEFTGFLGDRVGQLVGLKKGSHLFIGSGAVDLGQADDLDSMVLEFFVHGLEFGNFSLAVGAPLFPEHQHADLFSLEIGKLADLIVIDTNSPHLVPMYDPVSHIVYTIRGSDVRDVVIGGKMIIRNKKLLTIDLAGVMKRASRLGKAIYLTTQD